MTRRTNLSLDALIAISSADITTRITTIASATSASLVEIMWAACERDDELTEEDRAMIGLVSDEISERDEWDADPHG